MLSEAGFYDIPIGSAPSLVHLLGAFGESLHGVQGDESYRNGFWVLNLISGGSGSLDFEGRSFTFSDGCAIIAPPDTPHVYHFERTTTKTYAHFRVAPGSAAAPFPVVQGLGERFDWFRANLLACRSMVVTEPERATAAFWNLLWQLAAAPAGGAGPLHTPLIRNLMNYLAENLSRPLRPADVAARMGYSVTHLNRLCRAAFGLPLGAQIRRFRLDRALHLLSHTGSSVASIAAEVGLPDLQRFNKLMRRYAGKSPRALRRG